jgi:ABC-2 type transport system ATP-binding protein
MSWTYTKGKSLSSPVMLSVQGLHKQFGEFSAVDGISFEIAPGELIGLIGPNGAGKSTTVKMIAGLLHPSSGEISVDGHVVEPGSVKSKQVLGYVPDDPAIWPGLTGAEFLHLTGALYGLSPREREKSMSPLIQAFGLEEIAGLPFDGYSRGNRQKFSLVAGLMHKPKLLLVDEPIVGLDPASISIAKDMLSDFAKQGGAVLLVSHTLPVVEELADRILLMQGGRIRAQGDLHALRQQAGCGPKDGLDDVYAALTS